MCPGFRAVALRDMHAPVGREERSVCVCVCVCVCVYMRALVKPGMLQKVRCANVHLMHTHTIPAFRSTDTLKIEASVEERLTFSLRQSRKAIATLFDSSVKPFTCTGRKRAEPVTVSTRDGRNTISDGGTTNTWGGERVGSYATVEPLLKDSPEIRTPLY